jgi:outer membrane immunogenic protein
MRGSWLLSGVSICAVATSVNAADQRVKSSALKAAPPPVVSWTGWYGGIHLGALIPGDADGLATSQLFRGPTALPLQTADPVDDSTTPFGGVQLGYNYQMAPNWLAGIEADLSFSPYNTRTTVLTVDTLTFTVRNTIGPHWFGTLRARFGYLWNHNLLFYATGGFAYGEIKNNFDGVATDPSPVGTVFLSNHSRDIRVGYALGGGGEYKVDARWSATLEYRYLHFDHDRTGINSTTISFTPGGKKGDVGIFSALSDPHDYHTIRVGMNYRFWD